MHQDLIEFTSVATTQLQGAHDNTSKDQIYTTDEQQVCSCICAGTIQQLHGSRMHSPALRQELLCQLYIAGKRCDVHEALAVTIECLYEMGTCSSNRVTL
jgi:hypothetical protein